MAAQGGILSTLYRYVDSGGDVGDVALYALQSDETIEGFESFVVVGNLWCFVWHIAGNKGHNVVV